MNPETRAPATPLDEAKAALLRALENLERAQTELGAPAERVDLIVVWSAGRDLGLEWHEVSGWSVTSGPKWAHAALMRRAARAYESAVLAVDDEDDDDEDDD